jgi:ketosteroid isomerase-like protein
VARAGNKIGGVTETNAQLVRRGYQAALRGDLEAIREILHPDVRWHGGDPDAQGACRNRDEALEYMQNARRRRPVGELVDVIPAGEKVVVIMRPAGRRGGRARSFANLTTLRDGKVIEMVHYHDADDALAAAGVANPDPNAGPSDPA